MTTVVPSADLTLTPKAAPQNLQETAGTRPAETGDARFDAAFNLDGDDAAARAFLDPDARHTLLAANVFDALTIECEGGLLEVETAAVTEPSLVPLLDLLARWHALPSPAPLLHAEDP